MSSFLDFLKPLDATGLASELPNDPPDDQETTDPRTMNAPKAYGFEPDGGDASGDSQFNRIRKQQMGMGGPSGG